MLTKEEYFKIALAKDYLLRLDWFYTFFAILPKDFLNNKYLRRIKNKYEVIIDKDVWTEIEFKSDGPILSFKDKIKLTKIDLSNIDKPIETTIGRAVFNYIILVYNFGNKIPYINEKTSIPKVENLIADKMKNKIITVDEYLKFADSVNYIRGLTRITNISATYKNVLPPPNIDKIKKDLKDNFNKKYGKDWIKDRVKLAEYQNELKKVDTEWLKDDPTTGKLINGKIKDNARVKMFLTGGQELGFDKTGEPVFIENSLSDGIPEDKTQIAAMFNSSRAGSYGRGHETQKGGVVAKTILRAVSNFKITEDDCGTKMGNTIYVNKDIAPALNGRYIINNGKSEEITDSKKYINKTITIRSPMYCNSKGSTFCKKCMGKNMAEYESGINLNLLNISAAILTISLKGMHDSQTKIKEIKLTDMIS